jgi:hypothetical protein
MIIDESSTPIYGYCGLDCGACPAYIAKQTNDDELRKKTAEEWSVLFETAMKPEEIDCDGCSEPGKHIRYCDELCVIRKCAVKRNVKTCADCNDYACPSLEGFLKQAPKAKENLERIRSGK